MPRRPLLIIRYYGTYLKEAKTNPVSRQMFMSFRIESAHWYRSQFLQTKCCYTVTLENSVHQIKNFSTKNDKYILEHHCVINVH